MSNANTLVTAYIAHIISSPRALIRITHARLHFDSENYKAKGQRLSSGALDERDKPL